MLVRQLPRELAIIRLHYFALFKCYMFFFRISASKTIDGIITFSLIQYKYIWNFWNMANENSVFYLVEMYLHFSISLLRSVCVCVGALFRVVVIQKFHSNHRRQCEAIFSTGNIWDYIEVLINFLTTFLPLTFIVYILSFEFPVIHFYTMKKFSLKQPF